MFLNNQGMVCFFAGVVYNILFGVLSMNSLIKRWKLADNRELNHLLVLLYTALAVVGLTYGVHIAEHGQFHQGLVIAISPSFASFFTMALMLKMVDSMKTAFRQRDQLTEQQYMHTWITGISQVSNTLWDDPDWFGE